MKRILIIKVTSLGDIIQAQPVVADLRRAYPGVVIDWAADEAFAEVVHWNQGVERVLYAPLRRFKKARRWSDLKAIWASIAELREHRYDLVLDIHGVYKSAIIAFIARARGRIGYLAQDLGERGAAFAYSDRFGPRPDCDAWHGMRVSVSDKLGYPLDPTPDYHLTIPPAQQRWVDSQGAPVALFFHATSKDDKKWPVSHWIEVGRELTARGFHIALPWGSDAEHRAANEIAAELPAATVLPRLTVTEVAQMIEQSSLVVGTDTGFVHLAHALQKRTVMIFTATSAAHLGIRAPYRSLSIGDDRRPPSVVDVIGAIDYVHSTPPASSAPSAAQGTTPAAAAASDVRAISARAAA
jgi:heptosyltransferase I